MATHTDTRSLPKKTATTSYFLSILMLGLFTAIAGPALPTLAANTGSSLDQISLFFVLGSLGYLLGSFFGGRAYDRIPGHRLLALTLLIVAVSGFFIPVIGQLRWLLLVQFILGLAQGANDVGCNTLLLWIHGKDAGPFMNGLHFFFGVGTAIAPLILAGFLSLTGRIEWAFWFCTALCLPLVVWLWRLPEIPARTAEENIEHSEPAVLPVSLLVAAFALAVGAEIGFGNWIYTYSIQMDLSTPISAAYLTSAFWGTFTLGRLLGVWISNRLTPIKILTLDLLGALVSVSLIVVWPHSQLLTWLGTVGIGLFIASVFPTLLVLVGERITVTGAITGWMLVGGGLGGMFFPWLIGQVMVRTSKLAMPGIVVGTVLLNLIAIYLFNSWTKYHPESI